MYEGFWEPLLAKRFGAAREEISAAWLLGRVKFGSERKLTEGTVLGYLNGGSHQLVDALVQEIGREQIQTNTRVGEISGTDGSVETISVASGTETYRQAVDGVVIATMPHVLELLTGYSCDIDFMYSLCSLFSLDRSVMGDTYWLDVLDDAPFDFLIEHTNLVPPERYGGEHLLYAGTYVSDPDDDLWQLSDEDREALWTEHIEQVLPAFDRTAIQWCSNARNPNASPVYETGYLDKVVPYDLSEEFLAGVYYAGMASRAQYPERSLAGGVEAGYQCAELIADA